MRRRIPSTAALVAFEAAARHQSFTLAGLELSLTQSAIGRQVAILEELVGVRLFRRTHRGVTLTAAGAEYSRCVSKRLADVEQDALELASRSAGGGAIDLAVVPTFATHWLVPRLSRFHAEHPGTNVNLHVRTRPFLFEGSGLNGAIHAGEGGWPGTRADLLMREPMVAVCAPSLVGKKNAGQPADIARLPLVQMTTRPYAWRHWFIAQGVNADRDLAGPRVELFSMAVQAAVYGLGVALVPDYVARGELERGLLIEPVRRTYSSGFAYYLIYPLADELSAPMKAFRDWVVQEAC